MDEILTSRNKRLEKLLRFVQVWCSRKDTNLFLYEDYYCYNIWRISQSGVWRGWNWHICSCVTFHRFSLILCYFSITAGLSVERCSMAVCYQLPVLPLDRPVPKHVLSRRGAISFSSSSSLFGGPSPRPLSKVREPSGKPKQIHTMGHSEQFWVFRNYSWTLMLL